MNALLSLSDDEKKRGVITHSSGNHAQALALAAKLRGVHATVVMPSNAVAVKRQAVEGYGADVVICQPTLAAREETVANIVRETGATLIPPYDSATVMAGQGTCALELLSEIPDLDAIVAPVGGGGLLSGTAIAASASGGGGASRSTVRVFGAEPTGADDALRSKESGTLIPQTNPKTIADGLLTSMGQKTWPVIRDVVEQILCVQDAEIVSAMRLLAERAKLLVEPSAAVSLAATLTEAFRRLEKVEKVGVILSGGNLDLSKLPW